MSRAPAVGAETVTHAALRSAVALVTRMQFGADIARADLTAGVPEAEVIKALEMIACNLLAAVYRDRGAAALEQIGLFFADTGTAP